MKTKNMIVFLSCLFVPTLIQADLTDFQSLLESARSPIAVEEGSLKGEGASALLKNANGAQFLAIGEGHLNRETPKFTQALLNSVDQGRFGYFGIETGPYSARFLQKVINGDHPQEVIRRFLEKYPQSLPFVDHVGEFNLLKNFTTDGIAPDRIWGLDQEFIFSTRYLLDELSSFLKTDRARNYIDGLRQRAGAGYDEFKSDNADSVLLQTLTPSDFEELRAQLIAEESPEVRFIVDELEASRNIYRAYQEKRYYDNNQGRIDLFKANFMRNFNAVLSASGKAPRVVVKMGSYHAGRGLSPLDHFDIGNFLSEFAASLGQSSYHIMVIAPRQVNGENSEDLTKQQPVIVPFVQLQSGDQAVLFDLSVIRRNMRRSIRDQLSLDQVRLISAYDAVIVLPEFTSAVPIGNDGSESH